MNRPYIKPSLHSVRIQTARHLAASPTIIGGAGEVFSSLDAEGGNLDTIIEEGDNDW